MAPHRSHGGPWGPMEGPWTTHGAMGLGPYGPMAYFASPLWRLTRTFPDASMCFNIFLNIFQLSHVSDLSPPPRTAVPDGAHAPGAALGHTGFVYGSLEMPLGPDDSVLGSFGSRFDGFLTTLWFRGSLREYGKKVCFRNFCSKLDPLGCYFVEVGLLGLFWDPF